MSSRKQVGASEGAGIFLFKKLDRIDAWMQSLKNPTPNQCKCYVVQKYLDNPYLIGGMNTFLNS